MNDAEDLRHHEMEDRQQIIGAPPPFLVKNGITIIFIFTLTLLLLSWLIKYPDKVTCRVILTTAQPPVRVMAKVNSSVEALKARNNMKVRQGQVLAVLENPANYHDVFRVDTLLSLPAGESLLLQASDRFNLGPLQSAFSEWIVKLKDMQSFTTHNIYTENIRSLELQVQQLSQINKSLLRKKEIISSQYDLMNEDYQRNKKLLEQGVIANVDFEKVQMEFLSISHQLESTNGDILANEVQMTQLRAQRNENAATLLVQMTTRTLSKDETLQRLRSEISAWKQQYVLFAPVNGLVTFTDVLNENKFVIANKEVLTVVPDNSDSVVFARAFLQGLGIGKVKVGMKTIIHLDGYPYQEFGMLIGDVTSIGTVSGQEGYVVEIRLPDQLHTTYHKPISFNQEMQGDADIITENRSFLERIFDNLRSAFRNRV